MMRKPLNLHALRAFEAAARLESFKGAAAELGVTPVAVTRHIKRLEGDLRVTLFERLHRGVRLTDVGRELREEIVPAFAAMDRGVEHVRERSAQDTLHIGSETAFAKRWLAPRLDAFHELHPKVHVDLRLQDDNDELDGIIFYGFRQRFGRNRHLLFNETAFPVCSPALLEGPAPLECPGDLVHHCLLHDDSDDWWQRWFEAAGMRGIRVRSNETFFSHDGIYKAAIEGKGVMIGDDMVYGDDLAEGRLVRLFTETLPGNQFILAVGSSPRRKALDDFVDWILGACEAHKKRMKDVLGAPRTARKSGRRASAMP
jgi:LysR family glycine cleavage system transcriptional activator